MYKGLMKPTKSAQCFWASLVKKLSTEHCFAYIDICRIIIIATQVWKHDRMQN